ncbi:MAG: B12-binding domain-containing radical SAM protein, partial [Chloroflexi bacterium]
DWEKKAVDMNTTRLNDSDIEWADYVFVSAMIVQQRSTREVVDRCKKLGRRVVGGGPLFTMAYEDLGFDDVDHIILNEAEITLPLFLEDLKKGCAKHIYQTDRKADVTETPAPLFPLLDLRKYSMVTVQYSRGCPFDCEFCGVTVLDGHKPRTKTSGQILAELEAIYDLGYRGRVFIVDDNFIGNKRKLKEGILPAIIQWMKERRYPFSFLTEASINLSDDEELMQLMSDAGFNNVFVGIESPNEESLNECKKFANKNRDLVVSVKRLQNHGFEVMGGFIVGFDSDPISIFQSQIKFIQQSGIVTAMVGMLNAPPGTKLWHRLKKEKRLLATGTGDNTDGTANFIPEMDFNVLVNGYKQILNSIYSPKQYYERINTFLKEFRPNKKVAYSGKLRIAQLKALIKATFTLGIRDKAGWYYWKLIFSSLLKYPRFTGLAITMAVQGFHLRKIYEKVRKFQVDDALLARQQNLLNRELI